MLNYWPKESYKFLNPSISLSEMIDQLMIFSFDFSIADYWISSKLKILNTIMATNFCFEML